MSLFWVCAEPSQYLGAIVVKTVEADSPEQAIRFEFGAVVKPASPFRYDFCTQESGENGYRYWLLSSSSDSVSGGATLRSGASEAERLDV